MATDEAIEKAWREHNPDLARAMKSAEYASSPYFSAGEVKDAFAAGYRAAQAAAAEQFKRDQEERDRIYNIVGHGAG